MVANGTNDVCGGQHVFNFCELDRVYSQGRQMREFVIGPLVTIDDPLAA